MKVKRLLIAVLSLVIIVNCFLVNGLAENSTVEFMKKTTSTDVYINAVEDVGDLTLYRAEYKDEELIDVKSQKISLSTGENHFVFEESSNEAGIVKLFCLDNMLRPYIPAFDVANSVAPTIDVSSVNAMPGDTVEVSIEVKNNPGIFGAILSFSFDDKLTLTNAQNGKAFTNLVMTKPGKFISPCNFVWDGMDEPATADGEILKLTFKVSEDVFINDNLRVTCSYPKGGIVSADFKNIDIAISGGSVKIIDSCQGNHEPASPVMVNEKAGTCKVPATYDEVIYCSKCNAELSRTTKQGSYGDHEYYNGKCKHCGTEQLISSPTIIVNGASARPGSSVDVFVTVKNNPGIFGSILSFTFDPKLTLTAASSGSVFSKLTMTKPGKFVSPCNFVWDGMDEPATGDGEILKLTFKVADNAIAGEKLSIKCDYPKGGIVSADFKNIDMDVVDAIITVSE